ncbi:formate dehydrogenase subunit beta [Xenorhabdus mauleonii]|uniref:Formate dehydrogenase N, transmembrane n=1 Tax=Xenorhabdus mauleonii TaxID=351675 RepID=A0A1I3UN27_9GAMM|nr:formate dehydrogenase subunit beta [Xenorhabdus mauleonii]SFJ84043.1 Formate dehydrogenase N, transmembrane [Xenorhabdus mauleonii]
MKPIIGEIILIDDLIFGFTKKYADRQLVMMLFRDIHPLEFETEHVSIFHYVGIGPNRVSEEEEESALKDIDSDNENNGEVKK